MKNRTSAAALRGGARSVHSSRLDIIDKKLEASQNARELSDNLLGFFGVLLEWDKREREKVESNAKSEQT